MFFTSILGLNHGQCLGILLLMIIMELVGWTVPKKSVHVVYIGCMVELNVVLTLYVCIYRAAFH